MLQILTPYLKGDLLMIHTKYGYGDLDLIDNADGFYRMEITDEYVSPEIPREFGTVRPLAKTARQLGGDARAEVIRDLTTVAIQLTMFFRKQDVPSYVEGLVPICSTIVGNEVSQAEFAALLTAPRDAAPIALFEAAERIGDHLDDDTKVDFALSLFALTAGKGIEMFEDTTKNLFESVCIALEVEWDSESNVFSIDRAGLIRKTIVKQKLVEAVQQSAAAPQKINAMAGQRSTASLQPKQKVSLWSRLFGRSS